MTPKQALNTRVARLDEEQRYALLLIASGAPVGECLDALTDAVGRLAPGVRACVLLANSDRSALGETYSSHFPLSCATAVRGLPIGEALIGARSAKPRFALHVLPTGGGGQYIAPRTNTPSASA